MAERFFWNDVESVQCPPISRCPFSGDKGSVAVLTDQVVSMEMFLLKDPYLKFEESVLTRVLYKLSASLRRNKHYQYLKMIGKSLRKLSRLDLVTASSHVTRCCPSSKDDSTGGATVLLPSRQLLEFLLVKLLGAAELTSQTVSLCAEAFILTAQQITKSLFLAANCTLLSITSRLWALLKGFQEKLQQWYSFLRPWVDKLQGTQVQWLPGGVKLPLDLEEWIVPEEDTTQQQSRMQTSLSSVSPGSLGLLDHLFTSPVPSPDDGDCTTDPDASLNVDTTTTEKPVPVKNRKMPPVAQSTPVYNSPFLPPGEGLPSDLDMDLGEPVWSDISSIRNRLSRHVQENIVVQPTKLNFGEDRGEGDLHAESSKSARKRKRQQSNRQAETGNSEDVTHPAKRRKEDKDTQKDKTKETVQNLAKGKKRKAKGGNITETQLKRRKSQSTEEIENTQKESTLNLPMEEDTPSKKRRKKKTKAKVTKEDKEDSHKPLYKPSDFRTQSLERKHLDKDVENPVVVSIGKGKEWVLNASTCSTFKELYQCCQLIGEKVQEDTAAEAKLQKLTSKIKRCAKMESKGKKVKFDLKFLKSKVLTLAQSVGRLEQCTLIQGPEKEDRSLQATDFESLKERQDTTCTFNTITCTESARGTPTIFSPENISPVVDKKLKQVTPKLLSDMKQDATVKKKKKSAVKNRVKKKKKSEANSFAKDDILLKKRKMCSLNDTDEIDDIFRGLD